LRAAIRSCWRPRLALGHHLAALEAQRDHHPGIGGHQRGVALAVACQLELATRLIQPGRGRIGARLLALVIGCAHRTIAQQAAQARLIGLRLLCVDGRSLHLVGSGAHGQPIVGRIQPRQHLTRPHDVAHLDHRSFTLPPVRKPRSVSTRARTKDVNVRVCAAAEWVTVVTNTCLTTATGTGGSLQANRSVQAAAMAVRDTARNMRFTAASLEEERSLGHPWAFGPVPPPHVNPKSADQARFSLHYMVASALVHGSVRLSAFSEERLNDPATRALMQRVTKALDPEIDAGFPGRRAARVDVTLRDGRRFTHFQPDRKGDPELPLSDAELGDKLIELASPVIGDDSARALLGRLWALDQSQELP
jgi:hypothetical protein